LKLIYKFDPNKIRFLVTIYTKKYSLNYKEVSYVLHCLDLSIVRFFSFKTMLRFFSKLLILCMKLSKKIFITTVATLGMGMFLPSVKADTGTPMNAFTLDQASFGLGVAAPTVNVGSEAVQKGTFTYRTSVGTSDNFSVGTVSSMGASSSASSTPDYDVSSTAAFDVAATSQINQAIGSLQVGEKTEVYDPVTETTTTNTSYWGRRRRHGSTSETTVVETGEATEEAFEESSSGSISGTFAKSFETDGDTTNNVTVEGVGTSTAINLGDTASFNTAIAKVGSVDGVSTTIPDGGSAGTANGSASGSVNTSTSASASNSQFVSSFIQAY